MKAIGLTEFGGPEVLKPLELPEPQAGAGQVRIRVYAAAVNPTDTMTRAGTRSQQDPPPYVPGMDAAGVIDQIGPGAEGRFAPGEAVVALVAPHGSHGAYAERIVVPAESVVPAPEGVDFVRAATFLMNSMTARLALDAMGLSTGDTVAVTGAAGAFGAAVVQLAKADGLRVIADAKDSDRELVRELGADEIVERGDEVAVRIRELVPGGVPGLADGALLNERVVEAVADGGTLATVRGWQGPAGRGIRVRPVSVRTAVGDTAGLARLARQAEQGVLSLRVAKVFPAEQAAEAHRILEAGGVRGRLVLDFG
ncbi:NADP-dependent oxidoreductase [Amycolatopsis sp. K13G38]|uniref:NADP-dependent oxidoreductase n=1 Tax=Amycolatopsis acididurans TaxID=2724524 RepID=A0ABX1JB80_9PSEU|nr:NADP-dependent oxidoreductase [Amycolatopsis acididurans]NKQ55537.1 NADP-dependent oxidoreductase [Amycolatopsis acididurans]